MAGIVRQQPVRVAIHASQFLKHGGVSSFAFDPPRVTARGSVTGTIALAAAAPAPDGISVRLTSANPAIVPVPATLKVPGGASRANFSTVVGPVSAPTERSEERRVGKECRSR